MSRVLTDDGFETEVLQASGLSLVDLWAEWCGPCRMASPHVKRVAEELAGKAIVLKVNTDQEPALAAQFKVQGIPNFAVLKRGRVVSQAPDPRL